MPLDRVVGMSTARIDRSARLARGVERGLRRRGDRRIPATPAAAWAAGSAGRRRTLAPTPQTL